MKNGKENWFELWTKATYFFEIAHQLYPSLQQLPPEFHFVRYKKRKIQCVTAHKLAATNITLTV